MIYHEHCWEKSCDIITLTSDSNQITLTSDSNQITLTSDSNQITLTSDSNQKNLTRIETSSCKNGISNCPRRWSYSQWRCTLGICFYWNLIERWKAFWLIWNLLPCQAVGRGAPRTIDWRPSSHLTEAKNRDTRVCLWALGSVALANISLPTSPLQVSHRHLRMHSR